MMQSSSAENKKLDWLSGGGDMADLIRSIDWSQTPLGDIASWPQSLRTTVSLCLSSNFPINIIWGPEAIQIYNAGYKVVCGQAHPRATGESYNVTWASAWPVIGEPFERARRGETSYLENQRMFLHRNGYLEETFFTFSLSPIRDEAGGIAGLFHPVTETTATMLSERRTRTLKDIADNASNSKSANEACQLIIKTLANYSRDLPFIMIGLLEAESKIRLVGQSGIPNNLFSSGSFSEPNFLSSIFERVKQVSAPTLISTDENFFGSIPCGEYPEETEKIFLIPIKAAGADRPIGFVVAGLSTRLPQDESYNIFFEMLGSSIGTAINNARAYEEEKKRAEALAEVDRAKTAFFSNVSHEFRTPLTLMLGPLEDMLSEIKVPLPEVLKSETEVIYRNALRLLKLVNTLLDFTRIEANREQVEFYPTDIGILTLDLASTFRSAIERAGMKLSVNNLAPNVEAYIDHDMWEKIILNLLSNAFKYTLVGEINVHVEKVGNVIEIAVKDTGAGISEEELPKIFNRFHRVPGVKARTHEGTGIGLALIKELVQIHGGEISVQSRVGQGSTFTVKLPLGSEHLPRARVRNATGSREISREQVDTFRREAMQWLPDKRIIHSDKEDMPSVGTGGEIRKRIILADDNADMRAYVESLLNPYFDVETAANGAEALEAAKRKTPDLIVSDVMMPELDGFGLVQAVRANPDLKLVPIILLSARAGNEAKLAGLEQGVDDYLVKPFAARELIARVQTQLRLQQTREQVIRQNEGLRLRDEFIQVASHELKTPVTSLQLQLQVLKRQLSLTDKHETKPDTLISGIDGSLKQVTILTRLINDLLEISRIQSGSLSFNLVQGDVSGVVSEVIDRYKELLYQAKCELEVQIQPNITANFDKQRIEQVVVNLIGNVCKYAPHSSVKISLAKVNDEIILSVKDSGPGILQEHIETIFDRFTRGVSAKNISGLGLGLFISKKIIESHGGSIAVESNSSGSTFTVRFPAQVAMSNQKQNNEVSSAYVQ